MHNITMKLIPASRPQLCLYRRAWLLYQASSDITLQTRNYMPRPAKPVITIPVKVEKRAIKRHKDLKNLAKEADRQRLRDKPTVISCKRSDLNHKMGQTYGSLDKVPLASQGWKNRKSYDDYFSFNPIMGNKAVSFRKNLAENPTFSQLPLHPQLVEALSKCGFKNLTNVQYEALPTLLDRDKETLHSLIAAETGNGKTLCFLVPILQAILDIKGDLYHGREPARPVNSPFSVIVAPSRELATQIGTVARELGSQIGIKVHTALGGSIHTKVENYPREEVDIVVGSLGGLHKFFDKRIYNSKFVTEVVLDEIDTLIDDTFKESVINFLRKFGTSAQALAAGVRISMAGATFPTHFDEYMSQVLDPGDVTKMSTNQIHRPLLHFPQKFIRVCPSRKMETLMDVLEGDAAKNKKILIFCNKTNATIFLYNYLTARNYKCLEFSQNVHWRDRAKHLDSFYNGEVNILASTDLASRGLDTTRVDHVINFDFPLNPADYIHRAGRVGRVNSNGVKGTGKVTSLVDTPLGVDVLQRIEYAVRKNVEIHNVNNNIIRIIERRNSRKINN